MKPSRDVLFPVYGRHQDKWVTFEQAGAGASVLAWRRDVAVPTSVAVSLGGPN